MRDVISALLAVPPVRQILIRAGRTSLGFALLNRLSGIRRVYPGFDQARNACRSTGSSGYEHNASLHDEQLELPVRPSDYPAMMHIATIAGRRLFEFGSSVGNVYYMYRPFLNSRWTWDWTGYDLPDVVEYGRDIARERGATALHFASELSAGSDCDLLLFSGSLHYWEEPITTFFDRLGTLPPHVIVNRSPVRERGENVVVVQRQRGSYAFPCMLRSRERIIEEFRCLGYELVDDWAEPGLCYQLPLLPEYSVKAYSGFYFRLPGVVAAPAPESEPTTSEEEAWAQDSALELASAARNG